VLQPCEGSDKERLLQDVSVVFQESSLTGNVRVKVVSGKVAVSLFISPADTCGLFMYRSCRDSPHSPLRSRVVTHDSACFQFTKKSLKFLSASPAQQLAYHSLYIHLAIADCILGESVTLPQHHASSTKIQTNLAHTLD
jgi:hypothetical protein